MNCGWRAIVSASSLCIIARRGESFYWSCEIKALAVTLDVKPDPTRTLFAINGIAEKSSEYTLFNDILPVKPGSFLKIQRGHDKAREFFYHKIIDDFEPERYRKLERRSSTEILAEFEKLLCHSIKSMLVADAPIGAFVSGGIDSSLISAIAHKSYPQLKLLTANVLGEFSEYEDAKSLAKHLGLDLFDYRFKPEQMLWDWVDATYFYECPIVVHTNAIPFSNVARLARELNVKAVLTGEGADELFLGYPRLLTRRYDWLASLPVTFARSFYKLVPNLEACLFPNHKQTAVEFANQLIQKFESPVHDAELSRKLDCLNPSQKAEQLLTIKMPDHQLLKLLHRNDRIGMMASIEARFPYLDEDLDKFAINLPAKFKIRPSPRWHNYKHPFLIDKWTIRKTAEKYLPKNLVQKKKNGFSMFGHKFVRIKKGFFKNGWVVQNLLLNNQTEEFMIETQNPYFIAKLASVEIFGRIFGLGESREEIKNHVISHAEINS